VTLAGPAGWTVGTIQSAAATVTQKTATIMAARGSTSQGRADSRGHTLIVGAHLARTAAFAVKCVAALVADGAAVLARPCAAGDGHAGCSAFADVTVADLSRRTGAAFECAAAAIADGPAVDAAGYLAGGERPGVTVEAGRAHAVETRLPARARSAVNRTATVVADGTAVLDAARQARRSGRAHAPVAVGRRGIS
jgi:hypothetical protein